MARPRTRFTEEEKAYICKFYETDGPVMLADALDRPYQVIQRLYNHLSNKGEVVHYINLWDDQFTKVEANGWF